MLWGVNLGQVKTQTRDQAQLAYEFSPDSYTFCCLNACLAAEMALDVLSDSLSTSED